MALLLPADRPPLGCIYVSSGNARAAPRAVRVIGVTPARVIVEPVPLRHRVEFSEQSSVSIDTFSIDTTELARRPLRDDVPLTSRPPNGQLLRYILAGTRMPPSSDPRRRIAVGAREQRELAAHGADVDADADAELVLLLLHGSGAKTVYYSPCPEPSAWCVRLASR